MQKQWNMVVAKSSWGAAFSCMDKEQLRIVEKMDGANYRRIMEENLFTAADD